MAQGMTAGQRRDRRRVLAVVHQGTADPGRVGRWLRRGGYELDVRMPSRGDALPLEDELRSLDGVIVFGGVMSANDDHLDYIRAELKWMEAVLGAQVPLLGICLGGQLLARVLGGRVAPHEQRVWEIGYWPIWPVVAGAGAESPHFGSARFVFHWHQEGFEVPTGAIALAKGETFPNQAFSYGDRAYGLQFHPEATRTILENWCDRGADLLTKPGARSREEQLEQHRHHGPEASRWLDGFLADWLDDRRDRISSVA
ncbi:MAG: gamma-glutamyl-gamma-aminobutyrate hydrolase family protein [Cyanobacteria bacterium]|nr:gamma-glutamyl-gamma-aminobutyrate hydrolase family protein [Cyanobacteriota bacterium]